MSECILVFFQVGNHDTSNFDGQFTNERFKLTPSDKQFMMNIDQKQFESFTYENNAFVIPSPCTLATT